MVFQYRLAAASLIALSIYGGTGLGGAEWAPLGGSELAQTGIVFGGAFILGEIAEVFARLIFRHF